MHDLTGKIVGVSISYATECPLVTFELNPKRNALNMVDELKDIQKLSIKVDKYRERRSLDANAYCFVLIDRLAAKLNLSKEDVYRKAIKEIGGNCDVVCVQNKAVQSLCDGWARNGLGWQTDTLPSKIDGCTNVVLYYGSSTYDTHQMHLLISNIVDECKAVGIETKTPNELASMLEAWSGRQ